jgi:hypothetical protein
VASIGSGRPAIRRESVIVDVTGRRTGNIAHVRSVGALLLAGVVDPVRLVVARTIVGTGRRLPNHPSAVAPSART